MGETGEFLVNASQFFHIWGMLFSQLTVILENDIKREKRGNEMRKWKYCAAALAAACVVLGGCAGQNTQSGSETTAAETQESEAETAKETGEAAENSGGVLQVTAITEVFGDGQKVSAAALEYPGEIDGDSLSADDFAVEGQTITAVYTNTEAALADTGVPGNYVILKFAYENSQSAEGGMMRGGPGAGMPGPDKEGAGPEDGERDGEHGPGGRDGGMMRGSEEEAADFTVAVVQTGEILGTDGTVYAAREEAVESSAQIDLVLEDFKLLEYTDPETGATIPYSLYLPADYDETKEYPLVFFVADASANGDNPIRNLTQGNGAIVWATAAEQAKHECIVLSPQYTNTLIDSLGALTTDDNEWSDGLTLVSNLLKAVIEEYSVDENRIYGTGQSQGCMTNIAISDKYPDLFAAQLLVAGQWNVEEMAAMKDKNLWIVVCEGDSKAYPGMNAATELWESLGSSVARSEMWDSTLPEEELNELVKQTEEQGCRINYTVFENGSHNYTWTVAYNIEGLRDWLFAQTK